MTTSRPGPPAVRVTPGLIPGVGGFLWDVAGGVSGAPSGGVGVPPPDVPNATGLPTRPAFSGDAGATASQVFGVEGGPPSGSWPASQSSPVDLTRTNELLQQLLDEVRRGRQPFLPQNDRNAVL